MRDLNFFFKCPSFHAKSEYHSEKVFPACGTLQNSFFLTPIAEKPRFSRNRTSEAFGENFLETKRKSASRNP